MGQANRRRDWHRFPEALHAVDRLRVYVPGVGDVRLIGVDTIPQKPTDSIVDFRVRIPRTAAHGARIELADTVQVPPGVIRPVSRLPVRGGAHGPDGPQRRTHYQADRSPDSEGGRPTEAEARRADYARHHGPDCSPQAGMAPAFTDADLARAIGLDPGKRYNLKRARGAFEQLEADGIFEGEWTKDGKLRAFGLARQP